MDDAEDLDLVIPMYNQDEATNFNANIANDNNFKSFRYKIYSKLLGNSEVDGVPKMQQFPCH